MKKSKNIHLVNIVPGSQGNIDKSHIPLGIVYVGSYLKLHGFNVFLHHLLPEEIKGCMLSIAKNNPLWVGFSVLSGATTYWSAIASEMLKQINPNIIVVWGGHHPTLVSRQCLEKSYVDIVVRGEGEITSLEMSECLLVDGIEGLKSISGISYKTRAGDIIENEDRTLEKDIDKFILDFSTLDLEYYFSLRGGKIRNISYFSSRGCPFNCAFCSTPKYYGTSYRVHSEEYVTETMRTLKRRYGVNSVYFSDDNFYLIKKRARQIIVNMVELGISCDTLDVRLDLLEEDDLRFFSKHAVKGVFFGWESGNDRLLKLIRKKIDTDLILEKVALLSRYNIPSWGSGIILLPTETLDETLQTIRFSVRLRKILRNSTISVFRFMPLPGTDLTILAKQNGWIEPSDPKAWRKIDPIEPDYKVEWLPWMTKDLDRKFRYVQELSRMGIASFYSKKESKMLSLFCSLIARLVNKRIEKLYFRFFIEKAIYQTGMRFYSKLRNKRLIKTKIID